MGGRTVKSGAGSAEEGEVLPVSVSGGSSAGRSLRGLEFRIHEGCRIKKRFGYRGLPWVTIGYRGPAELDRSAEHYNNIKT